jgi:branched-chain amino acid transport system substrate-binding protein
VVAVLGEVASSRSLAMAPIAQANKIPMITPSSTNARVTEVGDYIFRTCYIDPFQGALMAKFIVQQLKLSKVAIFTDIKNDYSVGLSEFFKKQLLELGGEVVIEQSYSAGDIDFKAQLTAIRAAKPEIIYTPAYYTDAGLISRQARELGIQVPLAGGDGWDSAKLFEIGGAALNGNYFSNHYSTESDAPNVQKFITAYRQKFGATPDSLAALAYDAMHLLADAMRRANDLSGPVLRDAIAATKDFQGVTGSISFDANRNPIKPAVILQIKDGAARFVMAINP